MKNEFIIGFLSIMFVLNLTWWYGQQYQLQAVALANRQTSSPTSTQPTTTTEPIAPIETLNNDIVATHNVSKDCWITISGFVYDVSGYLNLHPGGASRIIPYCGQDATQAFQTRGGSGTHTAFAKEELSKLLVGPIGQPISPSNITNTVTATPPSVTPTQQTPAPTNPSTGTTLTVATVSQHSTAGNCWLIISNTVYAVSGYLNLHPGGANRIIPYCGQEATQAFQTRGSSGSHSTNAYSILDNYRIGIVNSSVTTQQIQNIEQAPAPVATQRGDDDNDDD